jgi:hypothetical protein
VKRSHGFVGEVRRTYAGEVLLGKKREGEGGLRCAGRVQSGARGAVQSDPIGVSDVQTGELRDAVECCRPEQGACQQTHPARSSGLQKFWIYFHLRSSRLHI